MKSGMRVQTMSVCACGCGKPIDNSGRLWKFQKYSSPKCRDRQQQRNRRNRRNPDRLRRRSKYGLS